MPPYSFARSYWGVLSPNIASERIDLDFSLTASLTPYVSSLRNSMLVRPYIFLSLGWLQSKTSYSFLVLNFLWSSLSFFPISKHQSQNKVVTYGLVCLWRLIGRTHQELGALGTTSVWYHQVSSNARRALASLVLSFTFSIGLVSLGFPPSCLVDSCF